ncbi:hypothetical protein ACOMHN_012967 [Nucella lapillus]
MSHQLHGSPIILLCVCQDSNGSLQVEEDCDCSEFMLQYACGKAKTDGKEETKLLFHTVYEGPSTNFTVKNLRTSAPYSFCVRGRCDKCAPWSSWSLPQVASTTIPHHQWGEDGGEAYSLSNEGRTATRTGEGLTCVLHSASSSYTAGDTLIMRFLDSADVSPRRWIGHCVTGAIFINTYGEVFVDGKEMKTKLPSIKKGTTLTFQTELLPNGKVRVSVQVDNKEVTLDWRARCLKDPDQEQRQTSSPSFYFALRFAQEHWKIGVE